MCEVSFYRTMTYDCDKQVSRLLEESKTVFDYERLGYSTNNLHLLFRYLGSRSRIVLSGLEKMIAEGFADGEGIPLARDEALEYFLGAFVDKEMGDTKSYSRRCPSFKRLVSSSKK